MFDALDSLRSTAFFERIRTLVKDHAQRPDVAMLLAWLVANYHEDGSIRSPQMPRRQTINVNGTRFWLVRIIPYERRPKH
jgi:hypothetical protein